MELLESRRLTGTNLWLPVPGAVADIGPLSAPLLAGGREEAHAVLEAWEANLRLLLGSLAWDLPILGHRIHEGGLTVAVAAPIDVLYTATEINEWAVEAALAHRRGEPDPADDEVEAVAAKMAEALAAERKPHLTALETACRKRALGFLWDDDYTSVGYGRGSHTFPTPALPAPAAVPWKETSDIPVALITGTNGKTTTVRLLNAMGRAAGKTPGLSSTDGIWVGGELVEDGDYSGPGGARAVLRHHQVDLAILETARGGLLRRGLPVERVDVALVTNVAEDHLGEYGVYDLDSLAETKLLVAHGARQVVLNADDERLLDQGRHLESPVAWFSLDPTSPLACGGEPAAVLDNGRLVLCDGDALHDLGHLDEIPMTLGGAARHNISNALAAALVAHFLGLPLAAIRSGLKNFQSSPSANPGRLNLFHLGSIPGDADRSGLKVVVDFAHNPHGVRAILEMAAAMPARRRAILVGQAGDRDDDSIRSLARTVWEGRPDRIVIKDMPRYLRGREAGEVPNLLISELAAAGTPPELMVRFPTESEAVRHALSWSEDGDLVVLLIHSDRDQTLAYLQALQESGWRPGDDLPA